MDLREMSGAQACRHPWESARAAAVAKLLEPYLRQGVSVLDLVCGDGYLRNLSPEQLAMLREEGGGIAYRTELPPAAIPRTPFLPAVSHIMLAKLNAVLIDSGACNDVYRLDFLPGVPRLSGSCRKDHFGPVRFFAARRHHTQDGNSTC
ncbi:hypothetical protein [Citrifermentans bremense]|uniref:hypothetical protein n=1 Tax=Citrifermentans bremense TaxID=60035 RepID=UPI000406C85B|nr:hypothetical protein [Citrifermentans bremense]